MKLFSIVLVFLITISCATTDVVSKTPNYKVTPIASSGESRVIGSVADQNGESLPFAKVMLIQNNAVVQGVMTDIDGNFVISKVKPGTYDLEVNLIGYEPIRIKDVEVVASTQVEFKMIEAEAPQVISLKPIIYLYPEVEMDIRVQIDYKGELTHTYPKYHETGWQVKAKPDGTLFDEKGMEYYALFWEGKPSNPITPQNGFVIAGEETAKFLEEKLAELGLNRREANEFIMFWLPQMENNPFNLIHFSSAAYKELAALRVNPTPETVIRVMMIYKPLHEKINFPLQDISSLRIERKGFTLVEWGGSICPNFSL